MDGPESGLQIKEMDCLKLPKWTAQQFLNSEYRRS